MTHNASYTHSGIIEKNINIYDSYFPVWYHVLVVCVRVVLRLNMRKKRLYKCEDHAMYKKGYDDRMWSIERALQE